MKPIRYAILAAALLLCGGLTTSAQPAALYSSYFQYGGNPMDLQGYIDELQDFPQRNETMALYRTRLLTLLPRIQNGANVNLTLPVTKGNTALHYACAMGNYGLVQWLLEHGANPNAVTNKGATPLQCASGPNGNAICTLLRRYGARSGGGGYTPAPQSSNYGVGTYINVLRNSYPNSLYRTRLLTLLPLIQNGSHVNITLPETKGNTALHYACGIGYYDLVQWLLSHGANPNAVTHKGATPLQCASSNAIRNLLRQYGARY